MPPDCHIPLRMLPIILACMFRYNGMCLNPTKSKATLFGLSRCLQSFPVIHNVSIACSVLPTTNKVTTLGVILDSKLTFDAHVSAVCRNAHFLLRALRHIRSSITTNMATSIAVTLAQSRLDYANSLLYRVSTCNIHKLQRCQNTAAHLILQQSSTPSLYKT